MCSEQQYMRHVFQETSVYKYGRYSCGFCLAHLPWAHASIGYPQTPFQNNLSVFTNVSMGILKINCNKLKFCQFLIIHCYLFAWTEIQSMAVLHSQVSEEDVINTVSKKKGKCWQFYSNIDSFSPCTAQGKTSLALLINLVQFSQNFQYRQEHIIFDSLGIIFYKKKLVDSWILITQWQNSKVLFSWNFASLSSARLMSTHLCSRHGHYFIHL